MDRIDWREELYHNDPSRGLQRDAGGQHPPPHGGDAAAAAAAAAAEAQDADQPPPPPLQPLPPSPSGGGEIWARPDVKECLKHFMRPDRSGAGARRSRRLFRRKPRQPEPQPEPQPQEGSPEKPGQGKDPGLGTWEQV